MITIEIRVASHTLWVNATCTAAPYVGGVLTAQHFEFFSWQVINYDLSNLQMLLSYSY